MCYSEELCKTNHGSVCRSSCCATFRIVYNNIVLFQNDDTFQSFCTSIHDCYCEVKADQVKDRKDIIFSTFMENMKLAFSVNEICELWYLLESANLEIRKYA